MQNKKEEIWDQQGSFDINSTWRLVVQTSDWCKECEPAWSIFVKVRSRERSWKLNFHENAHPVWVITEDVNKNITLQEFTIYAVKCLSVAY